MIYDIFLFNDEVDLLDLRMKILCDYVSVFCPVESTKTFSGLLKPAIIKTSKRFMDDESIQPITFDAPWDGKDRWMAEALSRNEGMKAIAGASPDDWVILGDVDEIPRPELLANLDLLARGTPYVCYLTSHYYYLNTAMTPSDPTTDLGLIVSRVGDLNGQTFAQLRGKRFALPRLQNAGWHWSYLGGPKTIARKLSNFSHSEYDSPYYKDEARIQARMDSLTDLFDRPPRFERREISTPAYPAYLVDHIDEFKDKGWVA